MKVNGKTICSMGKGHTYGLIQDIWVIGKMER